MSKFARAGLVLWALFLISGCQSLSGASPTPTASPAPDWKTFCAPDGGFGILMPGTPAQAKASFDAGNGPADYYAYGLNFNSIAYDVTYLPRPATLYARLGVTGTLKDLTEGFAGRQKYEILSAQDLSLGENPGHEVVYLAAASLTDTTQLVTRFRLYAVGDRLYLLKAATPTSNSLSPDIKQFLNSFRLLDDAACRQAVELPPIPTFAATPALAATPATAVEWKTFTSQAGKFSVLMPGQPLLKLQPLDTSIGPVTSQFFQSQSGDGREYYMVGYTDYPADLIKQANVDRMLSRSRDGLVKMVNGKLSSEKKIALEQYPGRDLVVEVSASQETPVTATVRVRTYFVKNRQYILMALAPESDYPSAQIEEYLDSFRVFEQ